MFVEHKEQGEVTKAPAKLDEASRMLLKAAEIIERDGWCQNALSTVEGQRCAVGALYEAANGGDNIHRVEACLRLQRAVGSGIAKWNDAPARIKEQVVAKLRAVALGL